MKRRTLTSVMKELGRGPYSRTTSCVAQRSHAIRASIALLIAPLSLLAFLVMWPGAAGAAELCYVDAHYQFYRSDPTYIEDSLRFDVSVTSDENLLLQAKVNPYAETFTLDGEGIRWRVMSDFSGGTPAGERDVTKEVHYTASTGILTIPAYLCDRPLSFVAQIPWNHPSHELVKHRYEGSEVHPTPISDAQALGPLSIQAFSNISQLTPGTLYPIRNVVSAPTGSINPSMLGCDFGVHNMATLCGYPEREGRYGFFVSFEKDNCELFELTNAVPGRAGASGTIITSEGDVEELGLAGRRWVSADCVEEVNNGIEIFFILEDSGSWVRIDSIDGGCIHCTFRLSINGPGGVNYQDVMGKFDLEMPYGGLRLQKASSNSALSYESACYRLEAASYGVYADPACSIPVDTLTTDAQGHAELHRLSAGNYWVREICAPLGFALDETVYAVSVRAGDTTDVGTGAVTDAPLHAAGMLTVQKIDADGARLSQGDASLVGATFEISYYDGLYADTNALPSSATRSWTIKSADLGDGVIGIRLGDPRCPSTGDSLFMNGGDCVLPLGTIAVRELEAPTGYLLTDSSTHLLQVVPDPMAPGGARIDKLGTWDSSFAHVDATDLAICDQVVRGGVCVGKVDAETHQHLAQGGATLEGAVIAVELTSEHPVVVDTVTYMPGDIVTTITIGPDGKGATAHDALPYGSYVAYELTAPQGYRACSRSTWNRPFSIRTEGDLIDLSGEEDSVPDQVIRGDLDLTKVVERSMERLGRVTFVITSNSTGESHVIVTDDNGYACTASSWIAHTKRTNGNDGAVAKVDGHWVVTDEEALSADVGIWFSGHVSIATTANDSLGALPYDSYTVTELTSSANEGLAPVSFTVTVERDSTTVACGTIANRPAPHIATELAAADTNMHVTSAADTVVLRDTIRYTSLEPGISYELIGTLHVVGPNATDAGVLTCEDGTAVSASISFTPHQPDGTSTVTFIFDASKLDGQSVVAFETLSANGRIIATHADPADTEQTVSFARLVTALTDEANGSKLIAATKAATVVDAVSYQGLVPGTPYRLVGTLMDGATGEPASTSDGKSITGTTLFIPETTDGCVDVRFDFDASEQCGRKLVAYQTLYEGDNELVVHAQIDNAAQTVSVPQISTSARDSMSGSHEALAARSSVIIDSVRYENLIPGETYELIATVVSAGSGEAVRGSVDDPAARASFTAMEAHGTVEVAIPLDASALAGCSVVVCEYLYHEGMLLAQHDDPTDADQTIRYPSITTEALDDKTKSHRIVGAPDSIIVDSISYRGLTPGKEYHVSGTLHLRKDDMEDGGVVLDDSGKPVSTQLSFVPEVPDGSLRAYFELNTSKHVGETLVAFEELLVDGCVIAEHSDIKSGAQTVVITQPPSTTPPSEKLPRTDDPLPRLSLMVLISLFALFSGVVGTTLTRGSHAADACLAHAGSRQAYLHKLARRRGKIVPRHTKRRRAR